MRVHILLWLCGVLSLALLVTQAVCMSVGLADIFFGVLAAMFQTAAIAAFAWGIFVAHDAALSRRCLVVGQAALWPGVFLLAGTVAATYIF